MLSIIIIKHTSLYFNTFEGTKQGLAQKRMADSGHPL